MTDFTIEDFTPAPISLENRSYKAQFFGKPGSGKTTFAASIGQVMSQNPNPESTVIIAADPGNQSLVQFPHLLETTRVLQFQGVEWLDTYLQLLKLKRFPQVETIVFDTYSHIQDNVVDYLMENVDWDKKTRAKSTLKSGGTSDIEIPGQDDYHYTRNAMRVWINRAAQLPMNVIFLAHVKEPGPLDKDQSIRPNGTYGVNEVVGRVVQSIGYTEVDGDGDDGSQFKVSFEKSRRLDVKSWIPDTQGRMFTHAEFLNTLKAWKEM